MTQYMLSVFMVDGEDIPAEDYEAIFSDVDVFNAELKAKVPGSSPAACTRLTPPLSSGRRRARS